MALRLLPKDRSNKPHFLHGPLSKFLKFFGKIVLNVKSAPLCTLFKDKKTRFNIAAALQEQSDGENIDDDDVVDTNSDISISALLGLLDDFDYSGNKKNVLDEKAREALAEINLPIRFEEVHKEFVTATSSMPFIPLPLPNKYNFITIRARLKAASRLAPLCDANEDRNPSVRKKLVPKSNLFSNESFENTSSAERRILILHRIYCESTEYSYIHREYALMNSKKERMVQFFCLLLSSLIALVLLIFGNSRKATTDGAATERKSVDEDPGNYIVTMVSGSIAAVISASVSWSKFAQYETLGAAHEISYLQFSATATKVESIFLQLRPIITSFDKACIMEYLEEIIESSFDYDESDEEETGEEETGR
eukprot:GSChrysophyteH1.ASY1.ANO1.2037.1 assembled CDS